jgi:dihydroneopterin aldolase
MFTIHLNKMLFFAHHGLHEEETVTGNGFEVDLAINFHPIEPITTVSETVNYVDAYALVKKRMEQPVRLLESLAEHIASDIKNMDDRIRSIHLTIKKLNPPISRFSGTVGVSLYKEFPR